MVKLKREAIPAPPGMSVESEKVPEAVALMSISIFPNKWLFSNSMINLEMRCQLVLLWRRA